jgi:hypothetical protein
MRIYTAGIGSLLSRWSDSSVAMNLGASHICVRFLFLATFDWVISSSGFGLSTAVFVNFDRVESAIPTVDEIED